MNKIKLEPLKMAVTMKVSHEYLTEINRYNGLSGDDFINDEFTAMIEAKFLSYSVEKRELVYYAPKPSFLDWLFGRTKKVVFELDVQDLMINPPKEGFKRLYIDSQL